MGERLDDANPGFAARATQVAPDGDADLATDAERDFRVVGCTTCGGVLKPDVVFFGESVPRARVDRCFGMADTARALLVVGSSLTVMSGYRFIIRARTLGTPVAIVNRGPTRGDDDARVRIDAGLGDVLPRLVDLLRAHPAAGTRPTSVAGWHHPDTFAAPGGVTSGWPRTWRRSGGSTAGRPD